MQLVLEKLFDILRIKRTLSINRGSHERLRSVMFPLLEDVGLKCNYAYANTVCVRALCV